MNYEQRGREIFSEKGKLVATIDDDGNPVMAPGMAGLNGGGRSRLVLLRDDGLFPQIALWLPSVLF